MRSSIHFVLFGCVLLTHLLGRSHASNKARQVVTVSFKMDSYSNSENYDVEENTCDWQIGDSKKCDVRMKMSAECAHCEYTSPIYYPGEREDYTNTDSLEAKDFGSRTLNITWDSAQNDSLCVFVEIWDVDRWTTETIGGVRFCTVYSDNTTQNEWHRINGSCSTHIQASALFRIQCAAATCGSLCSVPHKYSNFSLTQLRHQASLGDYDSNCRLTGHHVWIVKLFRYAPIEPTNAVVHSEDCREFLKVCVKLSAEDPCEYETLAFAPQVGETPNWSRDSFLFFLRFPRLFYSDYVANWKMESDCDVLTDVGETRVLAHQRTVFSLALNNRLVVGVIQAGCQPNYYGSQCASACQGCNFVSWECGHSLGPAQCAYESLCRTENGPCANDGICELHRADMERGADLQNGLFNDSDSFVLSEIDKFQTVCRCWEGFGGKLCELRL